MRSAPIAAVVAAGAAVLAGGGCASVLGVDKDYRLEAGADSGPSADAAPPADGSDADTPGIRCTGTLCAPSMGEQCCLDHNELACVPVKGPCETDIFCDDKAGCPGARVCCARLGAQNDLLGTSCLPDCAGDGGVLYELCGADGGGCPGGQTCKPLMGVEPVSAFPYPWFYACQE